MPELGAGHAFLILLGDAFPINVLPRCGRSRRCAASTAPPPTRWRSSSPRSAGAGPSGGGRRLPQPRHRERGRDRRAQGHAPPLRVQGWVTPVRRRRVPASGQVAERDRVPVSMPMCPTLEQLESDVGHPDPSSARRKASPPSSRYHSSLRPPSMKMARSERSDRRTGDHPHRVPRQPALPDLGDQHAGRRCRREGGRCRRGPTNRRRPSPRRWSSPPSPSLVIAVRERKSSQKRAYEPS